MGKEHNILPFKVGQMAEARSFIPGYRGAWFRCKIKEIGQSKGCTRFSLEYIDFPDEKIKWTQIYQIPPIQRTRSKEMKRELMVRPPFPPVFHENELLRLNTISEETLIVDNAWKVGGLVDWLADNCYWSGTVTGLLSDEMVKFQLPAIPFGEGGDPCAVYCRDLRPSLAWSPEHGWSVPIPQEGENRRCCARLIKPSKPGVDVQISSHISSNSLPYMPPLCMVNNGIKQSIDAPRPNMDIDIENRGGAKTSYSDSVSSSLFRDPSDNLVGPSTTTTDGKDGSRNIVSIPLNCEHSDTLEAPMLDLEELLNKVKWMKRILKFGPTSDASSAWKFVEHKSSLK